MMNSATSLACTSVRTYFTNLWASVATKIRFSGLNWKNYGLSQPRGSLPIGPMVAMVHIASVWVPFTSESKEAIAHYPEIIKEINFALQECGRRLSVYLSRRRRQADRA